MSRSAFSSAASAGPLFAVGLVCGFTLLYGATLYPGPGGWVNYGDSIKWQFLWAANGTPHSTGYPLYLVLSELASRYLTFVPGPERLDVFSLLCAVGALWLTYRMGGLLLRSRLGRLLAVAAAGTTFTFWAQATEPEVYALHLLLLSVVHLAMVQFALSRRRGYLMLACACYALSFGNHLMMITLLPSMVYLVWSTDRGVFCELRWLLWVAVCVFLGASQYLYLLYLSHLPGGYLEFLGSHASLARLVDYATGGQFESQLFANDPLQGLATMAKRLATDEFNPLLFALCLSAIFFFRTWTFDAARRRCIVYLGIFVLSHTLFSASYDIGDIQVYYLPVTLIMPLFLLMLVRGPRSTVAVAVLLVATIGHNLWINLPAFRQPRINWVTWAGVVHASIPAQQTLFSYQGQSTFGYPGAQAIHYLNWVGNADKPVVLAFTAGQFRRQLASQQTIFFLAEDRAPIGAAFPALVPQALPYETTEAVMRQTMAAELGVVALGKDTGADLVDALLRTFGLEDPPEKDVAMIVVLERGRVVASRLAENQARLSLETRRCGELTVLSRVDEVGRRSPAVRVSCDGKALSPNWLGAHFVAIEGERHRYWARSGLEPHRQDLPPQMYRLSPPHGSQ